MHIVCEDPALVWCMHVFGWMRLCDCRMCVRPAGLEWQLLVVIASIRKVFGHNFNNCTNFNNYIGLCDMKWGGTNAQPRSAISLDLDLDLDYGLQFSSKENGIFFFFGSSF